MDLAPTADSTPASCPAGAGEAGFTIIEVIVAALILAIVAAGSIVGFVGAIGDSGTQRYRSAAEALGQQNEAQLRGWTVSQLANLNQTVTKTVDKQSYTIQETGTFVTDSAGSPSCTNPSADYIETASKVTWANMPSQLNGVTVTGLITPTAGQITNSAGVLAVQVQNPAGTGYAGMPVSVTQTSGGSATASGVTASNGCVLFADLAVGNYTVSVTPASGTYVDATTNKAVSTSSPDQQTQVQVTSGTTAASPTPFVLANPGTATFSFTDLFPTALGPNPSPAPTATSPSVILANGSLGSPSYIACSNQDTSGCPAVGNADTSWLSSAWSASSPKVTAYPLAPYTYATYAGICTSDDPSLAAYGGADQTTAVTAGGSTATTIPMPSIVVRLYSGTGVAGLLSTLLSLPSATTEMTMPAGSMLVITDTGCNEHYVGGPGVSVPAGDSYLPVNANAVTNGGPNDIGLLTFPGMPDGQYTVCYQNGTKYAQTTITNKGSGEIVGLFNSNLASGSCAV